ncbi:hypothetical protein Enr10x_60420 [Gimesia panareensis]|uniref:Uncharacterized protein n=1 Tax=Gimesia panareensis TaxID=2527978 RepID=A0A517QGC0_9PLAN|nr:hypothetical protein Enr10x_60420 [Gimesia panareensis]
MKLPKFWIDTGAYNDTAIQISIFICCSLCIYIGYAYEMAWLVMSAIIIGPVSGFFIGFCLIMFLCTYCAVDDKDS